MLFQKLCLAYVVSWLGKQKSTPKLRYPSSASMSGFRREASSSSSPAPSGGRALVPGAMAPRPAAVSADQAGEKLAKKSKSATLFHGSGAGDGASGGRGGHRHCCWRTGPCLSHERIFFDRVCCDMYASA